MKSYKYLTILLGLVLLTIALNVQGGDHKPGIPYKDTTAATNLEFDEAFIYEEAKRIGLNPVEAMYYVQNIKASYMGQQYHYDAMPAVTNQMATSSSGSSCSHDLENNLPFLSGGGAPFYEAAQTYPWKALTSSVLGSGNSWSNGVVRGRHTLMFDNYNLLDPIGKFPVVAPKWSNETNGSNRVSMRLGNRMVGGEMESVKVTVTVDKSNPNDQFLTYAYALVLQDPNAMTGAPPHDQSSKPYFEVKVKIVGQAYSDCGALKVIAGSNLVGYSYSQDGAYVFKPWTQNIIDCSQLKGIEFTGQTYQVELEFITADCALGGHFGYAYVDVACTNPVIERKGSSCVGGFSTFRTKLLGNYRAEKVKWEFIKRTPHSTNPGQFIETVLAKVEGNINIDINGVKSYTGYTPTIYYPEDVTIGGLSTIEAPQAAIHKVCTALVKVTVTQVGAGSPPGSTPPLADCILSLDKQYQVTDCIARVVRCKECISSFAPVPGNKYVISAWVREEATQPITYNEPGIMVYLSGPGTTFNFTPKGKIIDGWQKIEEEFWVPEGTHAIEITLKNTSTTSTQYVYFDDIRVHPFKANMKSYVYDPHTQKLMAELDENNYATYYEYDEEGGLKRVKKETERGVMTIKENGSNQAK